MVLACDGLYDVFTNDEVVAFVKAEMEEHGDCQRCCQVCQSISLLCMYRCSDVLFIFLEYHQRGYKKEEFSRQRVSYFDYTE